MLFSTNTPSLISHLSLSLSQRPLSLSLSLSPSLSRNDLSLSLSVVPLEISYPTDIKLALPKHCVRHAPSTIFHCTSGSTRPDEYMVSASVLRMHILERGRHIATPHSSRTCHTRPWRRSGSTVAGRRGSQRQSALLHLPPPTHARQAARARQRGSSRTAAPPPAVVGGARTGPAKRRAWR